MLRFLGLKYTNKLQNILLIIHHEPSTDFKGETHS